MLQVMTALSVRNYVTGSLRCLGRLMSISERWRQQYRRKEQLLRGRSRQLDPASGERIH
jgi:hypothetical protein